MMESASGKEIRQLAHQYLDEDARRVFKRAIKQFSQTSSVSDFVIILNDIVRSNENYLFITELGTRLPKDFQIDFYALCCDRIEGYRESCMQHEQARPESTEDYTFDESAYTKRNTKHIPIPDQYKTSTFRSIKSFRHAKWEEYKDLEGSLENNQVSSGARTVVNQQPDSRNSRQKNRKSTSLNNQTENSYSIETTTTKQADAPVTTLYPGNKNIYLTREDNSEFGFNIRGGYEYDCGIYVSNIDEGSIASKSGLCVGDRIVQINKINFHNKTHKEAVNLISRSYDVQLEVIPCTDDQEFTIHRLAARSTKSLPSSVSMLHKESELRAQPDTTHYNTFNSTESSKYEREYSIIDISADLDGFIGCSIRGGEDVSIPAYISHVDKFSPAYTAGLRPGDQIISVNNEEIGGMKHIDIVLLAASCRELNMKVYHRKQAKSSSYANNINRDESPGNLTNSNIHNSHSSRSDNSGRTLPSTPDHTYNHKSNNGQDKPQQTHTPSQSLHQQQTANIHTGEIQTVNGHPNGHSRPDNKARVSYTHSNGSTQLTDRPKAVNEHSDTVYCTNENQISAKQVNFRHPSQGKLRTTNRRPNTSYHTQDNPEIMSTSHQSSDTPRGLDRTNNHDNRVSEHIPPDHPTHHLNDRDLTPIEHHAEIHPRDHRSLVAGKSLCGSSENSEHEEMISEGELKSVKTAASRLEKLFKTSLEKITPHVDSSPNNDVPPSTQLYLHNAASNNNNNDNKNVTPMKTKRKPLFQKNPKFNSGTLRSNLLSDCRDTPTKPNTKNISENYPTTLPKPSSENNLQTRGVYRDGIFEVLI